MSHEDPLKDFAPKADSGLRRQRFMGDGLDAIRHFFEDDLVSDIYSKENLGPESYVQPGHPCHGGYVESDAEDKP